MTIASDPAEPTFSREELIAVVVASALVAFMSELTKAGRLVRLSRDDHKLTKEHPDDLRALAKDIPRDRRQLAERAAVNFYKRLERELDQKLPETTELQEGGASQRTHPVAKEQLVAALFVLAGHERMDELATEVLTSCGGDMRAVRYALMYLQWLKGRPLSEYTARTLLPSLVTTFEELLAALVRLWLTLYPREMNVGQQTLTAEVGWNFRSSDDIRRWAIDEKVKHLVSGSPHEWGKAFERISIDISSLTSWDGVREIIARRHALVHAGGVADAKYLEHLPDSFARPDLGADLLPDEQYITGSLRLLEELGIVLGLSLLAKFVPHGPVPAEVGAEYLYQRLKRGSWDEALRLASILVDGRTNDVPVEVRVNWWMARQETGNNASTVEAEIRAWSVSTDDAGLRPPSVRLR